MNPFIQNSFLDPPREFPFPLVPYSIQKDFMTNIYAVLEERKLGIFESPTGTGKSLSIICGVLRWLFDHEIRDKNDLYEGLAVIEKELQKLNNNSDDDWLTVQSKQTQTLNFKNEIQLQLKLISEREDEINRMKKKFENKSLERKTSKVNKFFPSLKLIDNQEKNEDEDILLEDPDLVDDDKDNSDEEEIENKYENTKVYFCSRTHSQLSQFISEIRKSPYLGTRVVPLVSRQSFCVNPDVKKLKNTSLINERCLELQKNKASRATKTGSSKQIIKKKKCGSGCPYNNRDSINNLKEEIIVKVQDVEELVSKGKEISACPYYASRAAVPLSQLIVVPYNTLLHKSTREASKIKLKNNVVIIDEAHNLLDAIGNMYSSHINGNQLCLCQDQLNQYKDKYEKLFSAGNILYLTQLIFVIGQLISMIGGKVGCNPLDSSQKGTGAKVYSLADFLHAAEIDNFNLYKLLEFCQRSKISHKLQGFVEKYPMTVITKSNIENGLKAFLKTLSENKNTKVSVSDSKKESNSSPARSDVTNNPILPVISFLECLTNHCEDGRIICARQNTVAQSSLKFLLLNPAAHFEDIVKEARAVVVAGGTMQPISEFKEQLFLNAGANASRIMTFSCGHVIPPENILPLVLCNGPSGKLLDYSYQTRNTIAMMNELARILDNVCSVVPGGLVCFFPSYDYEQTIYQHFEKSGFIEKLSKKKKIFREPKKSSDVERVLTEFSQQISEFRKRSDMKLNGSLLLSVIGGKLSEGINFSDDLGRCVIVVGLPYPNIKSAELQEKMNYLNKTAAPGSGNQHYENLCMKAVNQSIGRAVRHKNDYATILLIDHRYSRENIQTALPGWMKPSLLICEKFGTAFGNLTKFFKSKT